MTGKHKPHLDTRRLSEKLEEHVEPDVQTIDISSGKAYRVRGNAHDITRLLEACKGKMRRIEEDHLDPEDKHTVTVPKPEAHS